MIRSTARRVLGGLVPGAAAARAKVRGVRPDVLLPFDMFDEQRTAAEAAAAAKLEGIYHKGQKRAWNGKELLAAAVARHGGVKLDPAEKSALQSLFAIILWGELAAWRVSADLSLQLEPLE